MKTKGVSKLRLGGGHIKIVFRRILCFMLALALSVTGFPSFFMLQSQGVKKAKADSDDDIDRSYRNGICYDASRYCLLPVNNYTSIGYYVQLWEYDSDLYCEFTFVHHDVSQYTREKIGGLEFYKAFKFSIFGVPIDESYESCILKDDVKISATRVVNGKESNVPSANGKVVLKICNCTVQSLLRKAYNLQHSSDKFDMNGVLLRRSSTSDNYSFSNSSERVANNTDAFYSVDDNGNDVICCAIGDKYRSDAYGSCLAYSDMLDHLHLFSVVFRSTLSDSREKYGHDALILAPSTRDSALVDTSSTLGKSVYKYDISFIDNVTGTILKEFDYYVVWCGDNRINALNNVTAGWCPSDSYGNVQFPINFSNSLVSELIYFNPSLSLYNTFSYASCTKDSVDKYTYHLDLSNEVENNQVYKIEYDLDGADMTYNSKGDRKILMRGTHDYRQYVGYALQEFYQHDRECGYALIRDDNFIFLPDLKKDGYKFVGWTEETGAIFELYDAGTPDGKSSITTYTNQSMSIPTVGRTVYSSATGLSSVVDSYGIMIYLKMGGTFYNQDIKDLKFKAHFERVDADYKINYKLNGGSMSAMNSSYLSTNWDELNFNTPTRDDFEFAGWTESSGATLTYQEGDGEEQTGQLTTPIHDLRITGISTPRDLTFVANWEYVGSDSSTLGSRIKSIFYDLDGGVDSDYASYPKQYNTEDTNTLTLGEPTRSGYVFKGWKETTGATMSYSVAGTSKSGKLSEPSKSVVVNLGGATGTRANLNFKAVWRAEKDDERLFMIDPDGGTLANTYPSAYNVEAEQDLIVENPMRDNYIFQGWTETSGGNLVYEENGVEKSGKLTHATKNLTLKLGGSNTTSNIVLRAHWVSVSDSSKVLNYDLSGGTITGSYPSSYDISTEQNIALENPIKEGCKFLGWTETTGAVVHHNDTSGTLSIPAKDLVLNLGGSKTTSNLNLKANFVSERESKRKLYYDLDGGSISQVLPSEYDISSTRNISMPIPVRAGYEFLGWTETTGAEVSYDTTGGSNKDYLTTPTKPLILKLGGSDTVDDLNMKANWKSTADSGRVLVIDANGGMLANTYPSTYDTEVESTLDLENPTRTGYEFLGWTETIGNTVSYTKNSTDYNEVLNTPTKDITLRLGGSGCDRNMIFKANWKSKSEDLRTINIDSDGAILIGTYPSTYKITDTDSIILENPTKTGYKFLGWVEIGGTNCTYTANGVAKTGVITNPTKDLTIKLGEGGTTGNLNLSARFQSNTVNTRSIYYDYDGGSVAGVMPTAYNIEDTNSFDLLTPDRNGYTFTGWTETTGADVVYEVSGVETSGRITTPVKDIKIKLGNGKTTSNLNFRANYKAVTEDRRSINYDLGGGSITNSYPNIYDINSSSSLALENPVCNGYTFEGWTETSGATVSYTESGADRLCQMTHPSKNVVIKLGGSDTLENLSLKANWKSLKETEKAILIDVNGGILTNAYDSRYNTNKETELKLENPTRTGYDFLGWTETTGVHVVYDKNGSKTTGSILTPTKNLKLYLGGSDTTDDISFRANWRAKTEDDRSIYYDLNGGSTSAVLVDKYNIQTEKDLTLPDNINRVGYQFTGWTETTGADVTYATDTVPETTEKLLVPTKNVTLKLGGGKTANSLNFRAN